MQTAQYERSIPTRFVCVSDTHMRHRQIKNIPAGDVLLHSGDAAMRGDRQEIFETFDWLTSQPHEHVIFVPGNHDFAFERTPEIVAELAERFPRVRVLIDETAVVRGIPIYGSPYQPWFYDWAFNFAEGTDGLRQAREKWAAIPDDTVVLITHGPVRGILDTVANGERVGCPELAARIGSLTQLRLHVCGHIHEAYGTRAIGNITYVNASSCDLRYRPTQPPIVVDFDSSGASVVRFD